MRIFFLFIVFFLLFSCGSSKQSKGAKNTDEKLADIAPEKKASVKIYLTYTDAHCGGVSPTPEEIKELNTPKPLTHTKIFLREGKKNNWKEPVLYEFTSNGEGIITTRLPVGEYSVVFENKSGQDVFEEYLKNYGEETEDYEAIDTTCLERFMTHPEKVLKVEFDRGNVQRVNRRGACPWNSIPCTQYKGNIPP